MISAGDLAAMKATLAESLPDSCQVWRNTPVSDNAGGTTDAWAMLSVADCRISPLARSDRLAELEVADRIAAVNSWILTFPVGTDVTEKDRIVSGVRGLEVASVLAPRTWEIGRRVLGQEIK